MLKMVIRMNDDKITAENKYRLDGIYNTINHTFQTVGLPRMEDGSGALVFRDCGRARDFSLFGRIVNTLKRQTWFMDNVSVWRLCDSDDSDSPDDFNEEDLLTHYQEPITGRRMTTCAGSSNGIVFLTVKAPATYRMISWQLLIYTT